MKRYLNKKINRLLLIIAVVCCSIQCTKVDSGFGAEIIPDKDKLTYTVKTLTGFEISTISVDDSIRVDQLIYGNFGSYVSPLSGKVDMVYTTELNASLSAPNTEISIDLADYVLDSVFIGLKLKNRNGLSASTMKLDVYDLKENFRKPYNNTFRRLAPDGYFDYYYSDFKYQDFINETPIATVDIDIAELIKNNGLLEIPLPKEWGERMMKFTKEEYSQDSVLRKIYKGLSFVPRGVYAGGNILSVDNTISKVIFEIYNKKEYEEDESEDKKKPIVSFSFDFIHNVVLDGYGELYNQMVTSVTVDRSYANSTLAVPESVINDPSTGQTSSYVSGLGDIITQIKFPKEELEKIKNGPDNSGRRTVIVTNAILTIPVYSKVISDLNMSTKSLATFYKFNVNDYMPDFAIDKRGILQNVFFNGILNRSKFSYDLNITKYIQDLLIDDTDNYVLQLAPAFSSSQSFDSNANFESMLTTTVTHINNTEDNPIKLKITYVVSE